MKRNHIHEALFSCCLTNQKLRWLLAGVLLLGAIFCWTQLGRVRAAASPALQGAAAINHLKQQGQYDSLAAAVTAARGFDVNKVALADGAASTFTQTGKLAASGGVAQDIFGSAVALSGNTAVVGAPRHQVGGNVKQGAAYVFMRTGAGWTQQAELSASDGVALDGFGSAVALNGDSALVGAYGAANQNQGAVYFFTRAGTAWTQQQKLTANDGAAGDLFGNALALNNTTAVIGATNDDLGGNTDAGSAYVFTRTGATWAQQQKLTIADNAPNDYFGSTVALSGETVLAGAPGKTVNGGLNRGAAYAFVRAGATWTQQLQFTASDGAAGDGLGSAIALSGETALISAPGKTVNGNNLQGAAYLFTRAGAAWSQQQKLSANDGAAQDLFGYAVALENNTLVIGAKNAKAGANATQGAAYVFSTAGDLWTQSQRLTGHDGAAGDQFGVSVALSGQTCIAGAWLAKVGVNASQGAAYIFEGSKAFPQEGQLVASDGATNDQFGYAVALSGDLAVIGAPQDKVGANALQGSAYVFSRSNNLGWTQQAHLIAADGAANDLLGTTVAISGQMVIVGAAYDQIGGSANQGSAYVFAVVNHAWTQQQKLLANDGAPDDYFGSAVALDGDTAIVGAVGDDVGAHVNQGSAYVYTRTGTTWTQQQKLTASNGAAQDQFGDAVALSGNSVVIGVQYNNASQGTAYVFTRAGVTWTQQQQLTASDGVASDLFGNAVAISGNTLIAGAYTAKVGANVQQGAAYVFTRSGTVWTQQQKLTASDGTPGARFGVGVALDLNTAVVGASHAAVNGNTAQGAAYVFTRAGTTWTQTQRLLADDGAPSDIFGYSVGFSGTAAVVGALNHNSSQGVAYVFNNCLALLTLAPATLPSGQIGGAYNQVLTAAGGTAPYNFTLSGGALPAGMQLGANGQLSGPATTSGTFNFTVKVTDLNGCAGTQFYSLTINPCPAITVSPASLPGGTTGTAYSQSLTATGGAAPYTFSVSLGALPPGVVLSNGALTGTPTLSGAFNFTIKATDANGCMGTQAYALNVVCPTITVNPATLPNGTTGAAYSQTITQTGGTGAITFSVSAGQLPAGLTLTGGGALTGMPTQAGTANFTVKATDANGCFGTRQYTLAVSCATITVNPASLPAGGINAPYAQTITATGGTGAITYTTAGTPPPGLAINPTTGAFSGTPTQSGSFNFSVTATDANGCSGNRGYTLVINACPQINLTPASLPNGAVGAAYSQQLTATGGSAPYIFNLLNGGFPTGLTLSAAGLISGTATGAGNFNFTLKATDANGCTGTQSYALTINCPVITLTPASLPNGTTGTAYNQPLTAAGGTAPYTFSVTAGALPGGVTLSTAGLLAGTPTAAGSFNFTVTATDANGCTGTQSYMVVINNAASATLVVTSAGDTIAVDGFVTLREAITAANTNAPSGDAPAGVPGLNTINFNIAGAGVQTIHLTSALPQLVEPVVIDGYTQPGASVNTLVNGDNAVLKIELDGSALSNNASGLDVRSGASGSTIRGLAINGFGNNGRGIIVLNSNNNLLTGNFIGLDAAGATALGNTTGLHIEGCANNTVGGASPALRNVISGNVNFNSYLEADNGATIEGNFIGTDASGLLARSPNAVGLAIVGASNNVARGNVIAGNLLGVRMSGPGGSNNQLTANRIGVSATGTPLGNTNSGVDVGDASTAPTNNVIGGTAAGAGNIIANNGGAGVRITYIINPTGVTGHAVQGNSIYGNTGLGIDLQGNGVTPNDNGDGDTGANNQQNFPVLAAVSAAGDIQGALDSLPANTAYPVRLELFANTACDASGNGEGEVYLGFITVNAPGNFNAQFAPVAGKPFITATATDANGNTSEFSACKSAVVCAAITITPATLPNGTTGTAYSQPLSASGGTAAYGFTVSAGALPGGLSLAINGALTGTPVASGNFNFTVTALDANNCAGTKQYTLAINCPTITVSPATLPAGQMGTAYNQTITATGGAAPYVYTVSLGTLPNGITLSSAGVLSGTPTVSGQFGFTVKATDANGCFGTRDYTLTTNGCPTVTVNPATLPNGTLGAAYNQTLTASGGAGPYVFSLQSGAWSAGVTLSGAGAVTGTPTASGPFNVTVKATDANGCMGTRAYTLNVTATCPTITVNPATLPGGFAGTAYNQVISATGGGAPYTFSVEAGNLPNGVTLTNAGVLSGTPVQAGSFGFTIKATDAQGCTGTRAYTVAFGGAGLMFYPLPFPLRLLDTRAGQQGCDAPSAPIAGGTARTQLARRTCNGVTIPATALAVTGNVTTVQSGGGYLTLYPSNAGQPLVANTNFAPNEILNNVFTVGLGNDGAFKIFATSNTDVVVDITGYYAPPTAQGLYFHALPQPLRLLETRAGLTGCFTPGAPLAGNADTLQAGVTACNGVTIPAAARALVGNATTVNPQGGGYLTLFPADAARPLAASSNFGAGQVLNAPFTVGLSAAGAFKVFTTAQTDLVIDVSGYYSSEAQDVNGQGLLFTPLPQPIRLLETRAGLTGCYTPNAPLGAASTRNQQARGLCSGVTIANDARGLVGNATVVGPLAAGYLTFWPNGAAQPLVAASNYNAGAVFNRHFTVGLGVDGVFNIFTAAQTELVLDVTGFFAP